LMSFNDSVFFLLFFSLLFHLQKSSMECWWCVGGVVHGGMGVRRLCVVPYTTHHFVQTFSICLVKDSFCCDFVFCD
jgi:hypothetical protein